MLWRRLVGGCVCLRLPSNSLKKPKLKIPASQPRCPRKMNFSHTDENVDTGHQQNRPAISICTLVDTLRLRLAHFHLGLGRRGTTIMAASWEIATLATIVQFVRWAEIKNLNWFIRSSAKSWSAQFGRRPERSSPPHQTIIIQTSAS